MGMREREGELAAYYDDARPLIETLLAFPYEESVEPKWLVPTGNQTYREMSRGEILEHVIVENP